MNRAEHMTWCKARANEYVNRGELVEGVTSMMSDLSKHDETKSSSGGAMVILAVFTLQQAQNGNVAQVRRFIDSFN